MRPGMNLMGEPMNTGRSPGWNDRPGFEGPEPRSQLSAHEILEFRSLVKSDAMFGRPWLACQLTVASWMASRNLTSKLRRDLRDAARVIYMTSYQKPAIKKAGGKYTAKDAGDDGKVRYKYRKPKNGEIPAGQVELTKKLRADIKALVDKSGSEGFDFRALIPYLRSFTQEEVMTALKDIGHVSMTSDRVFIAPYLVHDVSKSTRLVFPLALRKADKLPGGVADDRNPTEFDQEQLAIGTKHEGMEHTDDPDIAREIAMDHLAEDPDYYRKLMKIEKALPPPPVNAPPPAPTSTDQTVPATASTVGAQHSDGATGHTSTVPMAVGSRRIWNDRILEKKPDGKWHVVGHTAGMEGETVPSRKYAAGKDGVPLDIRSLTKEQVQFLLDAFNRVKKEAEKDKGKSDDSKSNDSKSDESKSDKSS